LFEKIAKKKLVSQFQLKMQLLMTYAVSKVFNFLTPSQQHKSAKQMLSQAHLMPLIKGFISSSRRAWARTH